MVTYHDLNHAELQDLTALADAWRSTAQRFQELEDQYRQGTVDPLRDWSGKAGDGARAETSAVDGQLDLSAARAEQVADVLGDACEQFAALRQQLQQLQQEAFDKELVISDNGTVSEPYDRDLIISEDRSPWFKAQRLKVRQEFTQQLNELLQRATAVDEEMAVRLKQVFDAPREGVPVHGPTGVHLVSGVLTRHPAPGGMQPLSAGTSP